MDDNKITKIVITHRNGWYIVRVEYTISASDVLTWDNKDEALACRDQYQALAPDAPIEYRGFKP